MVSHEWYQSFIAVYRTGTVTGAAEARFLTQPAVTQHLAALEKLVGEPLFTRTPRRMLPTARGKELYSQLVQALENLEQISQTLRNKQHAGELPLLRIGSPLEFFQDVALARLQKLAYRYWLQFGLAEDLLQSLEKGELDLIIAAQKLESRDLEYVKIAQEEFWLVAAPNTLKFSDSQENLEQVEHFLLGQKWISYSPELPIIRRFWQASFKKRPQLQPILVIPNLHAIARAVELGYGISLLPDYLCRDSVRAGKLEILWQPPQPIINEIWLAYRKVERQRPEFKEFCQALSQLE